MHPRFLPLSISIALAIATTQAIMSSAVWADEELVRVQAGELPIIISAPHGGRLDVPDVDIRTGRGLVAGPSGYVMSRDTGTEELADEVLKAIDRRFGKPAYAVIARFHRKHIDANRPADEAYEDPDAKATYDRFHNQLDAYCREVQKKFGKGLLLDLHGQGSEPETVFRGTQDGKTVKLLRDAMAKPRTTDRIVCSVGSRPAAGPLTLIRSRARAGRFSWRVHRADLRQPPPVGDRRGAARVWRRVSRPDSAREDRGHAGRRGVGVFGQLPGRGAGDTPSPAASASGKAGRARPGRPLSGCEVCLAAPAAEFRGTAGNRPTGCEL